MPAPRFIQSLLNSFPLVEYPENQPGALIASSQPSKATLWIHGPGIDREKESFDVACLTAQAWAAFNGVQLDLRDWDDSEGAPGGALPALHLPNGDLLSAAAISSWVSKQASRSAKGKQKEEEEDASTAHNQEKQSSDHLKAQTRTYTALVESKLQPALLAHLFLTPKVFNNLTIPLYFPQTLAHGTPSHPALPLLTRYAYSAFAKTRKLEVQETVRKLAGVGDSSSASASSSGPSSTAAALLLGRRSKLDLEELQRGGEEVLEMLEAKIANEGSGWFFGSDEPTTFDAQLYAHLHLVHLLHAPRIDAASPLRRKLSRCPILLSWAKRLHREYF